MLQAERKRAQSSVVAIFVFTSPLHSPSAPHTPVEGKVAFFADAALSQTRHTYDDDFLT
jgi:hypothetical protein